MNDDIPEALLRKRPELAAVAEALTQLRSGQQITARCIHCAEPLPAADVEATGALVITCPCGRTVFRAVRRAPTTI